MQPTYLSKKIKETAKIFPLLPANRSTPRPRASLIMFLKKYSAIGNSAIGSHVVLCSKLILKTVLLEVSYDKND